MGNQLCSKPLDLNEFYDESDLYINDHNPMKNILIIQEDSATTKLILNTLNSFLQKINVINNHDARLRLRVMVEDLIDKVKYESRHFADYDNVIKESISAQLHATIFKYSTF